MVALFATLALVGITWVLGSFLLGHALGDGDHGGGHDHDHDHLLSHSHSGDDHPSHDALPLLNGTSLAFLLMGFGIGGLGSVELLHWTGFLLFGGALLPGLLAWWLSSALLRQMIRLGRGGRAVTTAGFQGEEAQVIIAIPEGGVGEVSFVSQGETHAGPARMLEGRAVAQGGVVAILGVADDGSFLVGPSVEEQIRQETLGADGNLSPSETGSDGPPRPIKQGG